MRVILVNVDGEVGVWGLRGVFFVLGRFWGRFCLVRVVLFVSVGVSGGVLAGELVYAVLGSGFVADGVL